MSNPTGQWHTVDPGDSLSLLGERHRIPWQTIWEHPDNADLRRRRGNPNILHPGDRVFIPEPKPKEVSCAPNKSHRFRTSGAVWIRIAVLGIDHQPVPDIAYHFILDGAAQPPGNTNDEGIAEIRLPAGVRNVVLSLPWGDLPVDIAELAPAHTIRGIQQRLRNLGIDPGPIDGLYGPLTARGIAGFQAIVDLPVTGTIDAQLIRRLRHVHERETLDATCETLESTPAESNDVPDRKAAEVSVDDADLDDEATHGPQECNVDEDDIPSDYRCIT